MMPNDVRVDSDRGIIEIFGRMFSGEFFRCMTVPTPSGEFFRIMSVDDVITVQTRRDLCTPDDIERLAAMLERKAAVDKIGAFTWREAAQIVRDHARWKNGIAAAGAPTFTNAGGA